MRCLVAPSLRWLPALAALLVFAVVTLLSLHFWAWDVCADAGGVFIERQWKCELPAQAEYTPLLQRPLSFWLLVAFPAALAGVGVAIVVSRFRQRAWQR